MKAAYALKAARAAGIDIAVVDGHLDLQAAHKPAAEIIDLIKAHKSGIVAHLEREPKRKGAHLPTVSLNT